MNLQPVLKKYFLLDIFEGFDIIVDAEVFNCVEVYK